MKFLELNKKRHAVKTFNDKAVDYKDLRTAIEIATLAPSANNIQPWKFVVVEDKKAELAEHLPEINKKQVEQAQYVVAIFTDTDLVQRSRKIARIGVKSLVDDLSNPRIIFDEISWSVKAKTRFIAKFQH